MIRNCDICTKNDHKIYLFIYTSVFIINYRNSKRNQNSLEFYFSLIQERSYFGILYSSYKMDLYTKHTCQLFYSIVLKSIFGNTYILVKTCYVKY